MLELAQREVYAHYWGSFARVLLLPLARLAAGFLQHPLSYRNYEPGLLRQGNDLVRVHQATLGMIPTQQRFHSGDEIAHQREHGLIVNPEFVALDGISEAVLQLKAFHGVRVLTPVEDLVAGLGLIFC